VKKKHKKTKSQDNSLIRKQPNKRYLIVFTNQFSNPLPEVEATLLSHDVHLILVCFRLPIEENHLSKHFCDQIRGTLILDPTPGNQVEAEFARFANFKLDQSFMILESFTH
jgi:hypothetical protein